MSSDDESLARLAAHDLEPELAERIRRRAHAVLKAERALAQRPQLARAARLYNRALEPTLVIGACVAHLVWAAQITLDLMR